MTLILNGESRAIQRATNVAELVEELGLPAPVTLVEHNGLALRRTEWTEQVLADGDRLEFVRVVAGG